MSDFIFSNQKQDKGKLTHVIQSIYETTPPEVYEYHGSWGSIGVSKGHYQGFMPVETEHHVCLIIGGPVLEYQPNDFLSRQNSNVGTQRVFKRMIEKTLNPLDDLNGPFVIVLLDKKALTISLITDIGMYIPVYFYNNQHTMVMGTHVDLVAKSIGKMIDYDQASLADFFINAAVTHPYTVYNDIFQMNPSSQYQIALTNYSIESYYYWTPRDVKEKHDIHHAAKVAREALLKYVSSITLNLDEVASFISGGEDSRLILAMLPNKCKKDTFILLDAMNKEGKIAQKASQAYGANFTLITRDFYHYLDILKPSSRLVGHGAEYMHCHTFGLSQKASLDKYSAVFGGYQGDTILKAYWLNFKRSFNKTPTKRLEENGAFSQQYPLEKGLIKSEVMQEIESRKKLRCDAIAKVTQNVQEWYHLWPRTMGPGMVNYFCNRRLFASYEPFMIKEMFFVVAATPPRYRFNRKMYHLMAKPYFYKTRFLKNVNGTFPYYHLLIDDQIIFAHKALRRIRKQVFKQKKSEYSWSDWHRVFSSKQWHDMLSDDSKTVDEQLDVFTCSFDEVLMSSQTNNQIKLNMIQTLKLVVDDLVE